MALSVLLILALCSVRVWTQLTEEEIRYFTSRNVSITHYNDTHLLFVHNGIPDHEYGPFPNEHNPNNVTEQRHMFYIRKTPLAIDSPMCLSLGSIAMSINGIPLYNPYSGEGFNAVEGECREIFDVCNGHPSPDGIYHYHQIPNCLYSQAPDQLIGVALDGHPIYGPLTKDGINLTSADLDVCHGRFVNGKYEYRMTYDFPYILSCFHSFGFVQMGGNGSMIGGMQQPPGGGMPPLNGGMPPPNGGMPPPNGGMTQQPVNGTCIRKVNWETLICYADCKDTSFGCDNKTTTTMPCKDPSQGCDNKTTTTSSGKGLLMDGISGTYGISPNNIVLATMMCVIIYYANILS